MSDAVKKACPLQGGKAFICEGEISHYTCHFYNPNSLQCVVFDIAENLRDIPKALSFLSLEPGQAMKPPVEFTDHRLYIEEIKRDEKAVYRGIVRSAIKEYGGKDSSQTFEAYSTYIVGDQVIRLSEDCGGDAIASVIILDKIKTVCIECLLEFRHGIIEI